MGTQLNGDGVTLLNTIRANGTSAYQERVPVATANNIKSVGSAMLQYEAVANEFVDALVNRIGLVLINSRIAWNPLKPLKKGMLELGQSIEDTYIDLIKAQVYSPRDAENDLFKRSLPNVDSIFHTVNSQLKYPLTISNEQLKMAFISYNGLDRFISKLVDSMYSSATQDEFLQMKALIADYGDKGLFQTVTIPPVVDEASSREAMVNIKAVSDSLTFMSRAYNSAGVWNLTPKEDQYLLVTPVTNARLDVDVLAKAFNMERTEFTGHIIVVDDLGGLETKGVAAVLVDREWMQVYDTLRTFKTAYNGSGMYWNYFYHVWMIYSTSRFYNAVAFVTGTPTVTTFEITPATATLKAGGTVQLIPSVVGTNNPTSVADYEMSGNTDNESYVTPLGKVVLGSRETGPTVTVTATSVADGTKTDTCVITVS